MVASRWRKKTQQLSCLSQPFEHGGHCGLIPRSGRTPGGADLPGLQQGWISGAGGLSGRLRQAHQHSHRQGGSQRDHATDREWLSCSKVSLTTHSGCPQVIGSFSCDGAKDEKESNSVESVGFCNTWVFCVTISLFFLFVSNLFGQFFAEPLSVDF